MAEFQKITEYLLERSNLPKGLWKVNSDTLSEKEREMGKKFVEQAPLESPLVLPDKGLFLFGDQVRSATFGALMGINMIQRRRNVFFVDQEEMDRLDRDYDEIVSGKTPYFYMRDIQVLVVFNCDLKDGYKKNMFQKVFKPRLLNGTFTVLCSSSDTLESAFFQVNESYVSNISHRYQVLKLGG